MKKLSSTLFTIHAVLNDAEQKQLQDKAVQTWLKELNNAAYETDDILDECATEALRCESEGQGSPSASLKRKDVCKVEDVSVYPILGIGGLGKTTLAQMAFNDESVKHHFDPKIWVYVSQDFNVKRVIKATIESANGKRWKAVDLDLLQRRLHDMLEGK
ncbi:hypothetical protein ACSBR2_037354 [Camellia fascicularis]